jgi:hypothetical protein
MAWIAAELGDWPTKDAMAKVLRNAGLRIRVGRYSIRVEDCGYFVFQQYGGDISEPAVEADTVSAEQIIREAKLVSQALARAGVKHRFEVYNDSRHGVMVGYLHHEWPMVDDAEEPLVPK